MFPLVIMGMTLKRQVSLCDSGEQFSETHQIGGYITSGNHESNRDNNHHQTNPLPKIKHLPKYGHTKENSGNRLEGTKNRRWGRSYILDRARRTKKGDSRREKP